MLVRVKNIPDQDEFSRDSPSNLNSEDGQWKDIHKCYKCPEEELQQFILGETNHLKAMHFKSKNAFLNFSRELDER